MQLCMDNLLSTYETNSKLHTSSIKVLRRYHVYNCIIKQYGSPVEHITDHLLHLIYTRQARKANLERNCFHVQS